MNPAALDVTVALDLMMPSISILETDDVHTALEKMLASGQRELVVLDEQGLIAGFLDEAEIHAAYHRVTSRAAGGSNDAAGPSPSNRDGPWSIPPHTFVASTRMQRDSIAALPSLARL